MKEIGRAVEKHEKNENSRSNDDLSEVLRNDGLIDEAFDERDEVVRDGRRPECEYAREGNEAGVRADLAEEKARDEFLRKQAEKRRSSPQGLNLPPSRNRDGEE